MRIKVPELGPALSVADIDTVTLPDEPMFEHVRVNPLSPVTSPVGNVPVATVQLPENGPAVEMEKAVTDVSTPETTLLGNVYENDWPTNVAASAGALTVSEIPNRRKDAIHTKLRSFIILDQEALA